VSRVCPVSVCVLAPPGVFLPVKVLKFRARETEESRLCVCGALTSACPRDGIAPRARESRRPTQNLPVPALAMPLSSPHSWKPKTSNWVAEADNHFKTESIPDPRQGYKPQSKLVHSRQSRVNQPDDAFGGRIMKTGEHHFVFEVNSQRSSGCGMRVGVASSDGRDRWGIRLVDGCAVYVGRGMDSAEARDRQLGGMLTDKPPATIGGTNYRECAVTRRVEVFVDMARRIVKYSVDGGYAFDSGVLPEDYSDALVPWAQTFYKGDTVTLSQHRSRAATRPSSPRLTEAKTPKKKPRDRWDSKPFEAGPWTP